MNDLEVTLFLKNKIENSSFIVRCFIFGSIAKGSAIPNDCDLFVVTNQTPYLTNWKVFLSEIEKLQDEFEMNFSLKLNVIINTEEEFSEYSAFKERVLNRPTIDIISGFN